MKFANPEYLYLLLLVPAVAVMHWMARRAAHRKRARFGRPELVRSLMPDTSPAKGWIHLSLTLAMIALAVLILARPRAGKSHEKTTIHGIEMIVAVDVSNSMLASSTSDPGDVSRLMRAKLIAERLIDHSATDKVGLVVFAGNAYMQMPVTNDLRAAKLFLSNLSTDMAPTQGTAIGTAIRLASQSFSQSKKSQKAIVVITDGENFEDDAEAEARAAARDGRQVDVIGVGSPDGAPIPLPGGSYLVDESTGEPVTTRLDEQGARAIAQAGDGAYVNGNASDAVPTLKRTLDNLAKADLDTVDYTRHEEQFPVLAWLVLILIVAAVLVSEARTRWFDKFNLFNRQNNA